MVQSIPYTTDTNEITDILNSNAHDYGEYGGQTLTFYQGDVAAGWGASLTDADGNVFTLQLMGGDFSGLPLANLYENGHDISNGEGFFASMRLVNGEVVAQNGKGYGWFGEHMAGATDPGPGDNANTPVVTPTDVTDDQPQAVPADDPPATTDETPVATADETPAANTPDPPAVDTAEDTPASSPDDTVVNLSDVVHANHYEQHHQHRMNFAREAAADTTTSSHDVSVSGTVSAVSQAVVTDLCASACADLTGTGVANIAVDKIVSSAAGNDDSVSCQSVVVDQSTTSLSQLFAHCHQQAGTEVAPG